MEPQAAVQEFEESVAELNAELDRLSRNIQGVAQYQTSVFHVTKVLCTWMDKIEALARHRAQTPPTSASSQSLN